MTVTQALDELRRCAGTQFDPDVVAAFCAIVERADKAQRRRARQPRSDPRPRRESLATLRGARRPALRAAGAVVRHVRAEAFT